MAVDWIKMRKELAQDVAVIAMCDKLNLDEYSVVGRLHAVWSWADGQIAEGCDGNAHGVTLAFFDRYVGVAGFSAAMVAVGWLEQTDTGIRFPKFERHNTQTAKTRALTAIRAASFRKKSNDGVTPPALRNAQPQNRREEKEKEKEPKTTTAEEAAVESANGDSWSKPKRAYSDPPKPAASDPAHAGEVKAMLVDFGFNPSNAYNHAKKPNATPERVRWLVADAKRRLEAGLIDRDKAMGFVVAGIRDGLDPDPGPKVESWEERFAKKLKEDEALLGPVVYVGKDQK